MACIARDNALDYLIKKGAINDTRKILDISLFILIISSNSIKNGSNEPTSDWNQK